MNNNEIELRAMALADKLKLEQSNRYIAALQKRIDGLTWLIANGEKAFGSLWRKASQADVQLMMEKDK